MYGKPVLQHVVERVKYSKCADKVIIATSVEEINSRLLFAPEPENSSCTSDTISLLTKSCQADNVST